ncbi:hypothetical protein [Prauserella alba]|uniref:Uncharacterized protein n=1 Tax=Prauserella alba TaxID=176898 RepID=A0ABN1V501_9PSEU|nr:hypothetical protein [Prauserella alba]MCP2180058.1 hypothetical protein [Prauserella alba]
MTPHALPDASKQPVIAPSVQRAIDAAEGAPPVHLGVLNPTADDTDPYQPQQTGGAAEPDGIQTSHLLGEECATGGQVRRHGTGWECTTIDTGATQPGTLSSDGDQPYGFRADTDEAAKYGDEAVEGVGDVRTYVDLTKGRSIRNVGTDTTHKEFVDTLTRSGWISRTSKDGTVQIFSMDGAKYVVRGKNSSGYPGWTADFTPQGSTEKTLEIRLGYKP